MLNNNEIKRGQVYFAEMPDAFGSEQGGYRPVLIIQNNVGNKYSRTTLVAPLTTSRTKNNLPIHVFVEAKENHMAADSIVLLEQVRVIDKTRLKNYVTYLNEPKMIEIDTAISVSFGIGSS